MDVLASDAADAAADAACQLLLGWHDRFTRFAASSELSRLNADRCEVVAVSPAMARFAETAVGAAQQTGGLVDATLLRELEDAGYRGDLRAPVPLGLVLRLAPPRRPASSGVPRWRTVAVDRRALTIRRPPGVRLDGGGIVKGLAADVLATRLARTAAFAVDCAGDVRVGGADGLRREVRVASPFGDEVLHRFTLVDGAAATSGIGRRSWLDAAGRPAHHLLDPSTGRPAFTGVVQATALAPTAVEAEVRAKAAVLAGPAAAADWLPHGGVVVLDDGGHRVVAAA